MQPVHERGASVGRIPWPRHQLLLEPPAPQRQVKARTAMCKTSFAYLAAPLLVACAAVTTIASSDANQTLRDIFDRSAYTTSDVDFPANAFIFSQGGDVAVGR